MRYFMKKLFLSLALAFLLLSCDNSGMKANPYPDGVYPFEVANVSQTRIESLNYTITWENPEDSGFKNVQVEMYTIMGTVEYNELLMYSSATGEISDWALQNLVLEKNRLLFTTNRAAIFLIIKCVDNYGNISTGVKYEISYDRYGYD
jgi:hypothetical protein